MKVVLFCGGLGLRIRDADNIPKPLAQIGYRPVLWHVMKYYAHFGHKDFILCLGYGADSIKKYFLEYSECVSNDFVLSLGGKKIELYNSDIHDWRITFAETGVSANIGQRLKAVERYLDGEEEFLANYSDGLTDLQFPDHLKHFREQGKIASFLCVRPNLSYHVVSLDEGGSNVSGLGPGEELVLEPFQRLIDEKQLAGYAYDGFWAGMDTFKDKEQLETLWGSGQAPWHVWRDGKEEQKRPAPAPVAEFVDRRSSMSNGITGTRRVVGC
jgi:glucose-1-phosphate cytidylyltransferase